jgi:hypothetical protein
MKILKNINRKTAEQLYVYLTLKLQQLFKEKAQVNFTLDFIGAYDKVKVIFTQFPDFEGFTVFVHNDEVKISSPHDASVPVPIEIVEILYNVIASFVGDKEQEKKPSL